MAMRWTGRLAAMGALAALIMAVPALADEAPAKAEAVPPRIDTADFAERPFVSRPVLSPDGLHLAARFRVKGVERLGIASVSGNGQLQTIGIPEKEDLLRYFWAGNKTLIIAVGTTVPWYDDEGYATRLEAFDIDTEKFRVLDNKVGGLTGDDVLWVDPEGKSLIMAYQGSVYDYPDIWKMEVATNHAVRVTTGFEHIWNWYADSDGVARYGFGYLDNHNWQMVYRASAKDHFKVVAHGNDDKDDDRLIDGVYRLAIGSDTGYTLARDEKQPFWSLYEYNFAKHEFGKLIYSVPGSDLDDVAVSENGQALVSAMHTDSRNRIHWFDEKLATLQADLDKAVGADNEAWIVTHNHDYSMLVIYLLSSVNPGSFYLYQPAEGVMHRFAKVNEKLDIANLAPVKYVHYKARDGKDLPAYLTLPKGRPAKGLPLIIMPHGGPFDVRDEGDFDEEVQFFANRGYAVLQPQFRGSGSYGKDFEDAAKGQWGRGMQDDLDDGMDWLVKDGVVDAKRVCMIGSSYGGYAALWAATRNPERYRCAASFAGISDVPKWLKYSGRFEGAKHKENWRERLQGDKTFDLKTVSPLYTVDRLQVPVLIAHGEADTRVPFKQSSLYEAALTAAHKPHEFIAIPKEGHGFTTTEHEKLWLDKLDAFLAKYNPAG